MDTLHKRLSCLIKHSFKTTGPSKSQEGARLLALGGTRIAEVTRRGPPFGIRRDPHRGRDLMPLKRWEDRLVTHDFRGGKIVL